MIMVCSQAPFPKGIHLLTAYEDTVIWIGDFNYRIGLGSDKVRQLIKMGDLETLYENDQVALSSPDSLRQLLTRDS
jgi:hypothetical protein